jgi:hypothetical protein
MLRFSKRPEEPARVVALTAIKALQRMALVDELAFRVRERPHQTGLQPLQSQFLARPLITNPSRYHQQHHLPSPLSTRRPE